MTDWIGKISFSLSLTHTGPHPASPVTLVNVRARLLFALALDPRHPDRPPPARGVDARPPAHPERRRLADHRGGPAHLRGQRGRPALPRLRASGRHRVEVLRDAGVCRVCRSGRQKRQGQNGE